MERFWALFVRVPSGCWEWQGAVDPGGYGCFTDLGTTWKAHRWSYEHFVTEIPEGLHLDHLCRNRHCVNPSHLEPVTCLVNVRRSEISTASINAAKTHCPQGHPYEGDNLRVYVGRRYCVACNQARTRAWQADRKAERSEAA